MNFITSGFLMAGIAAASLPIVIHLLLRQRARVHHIGSIRFLKHVVNQHTRRRKIRQWILLAMRVLAVLLLATLFARPFLDRSAEAGRNREVAVLIDRSASMQAPLDGDSIFTAATTEAQHELSLLDENTAVHIATFDAGGVFDVNQEDLDAGQQPLDTATDYGIALSWARDLMTTSGRPFRKVVLITDLQRTGLNRTRFSGFPGNVDLAIRDVGRAMSRNISIEGCQPIITELRPRMPIRISARLHNAGAVSVENLEVTLTLDGPQGKISTQEQTALSGGARGTVDFLLPEIETAGIYTGLVSIAVKDDLAFDNQRWVAFEARQPDRLLLIDGQEGHSVFTNETYYLETALRLQAQPGESPTRSFEVERLVWEDGEGFPNLTGFRAIVMANVRRMSASDVRELRSYVESGGNLLFFFGDQTKRTTISQLREDKLFLGSIARDATIGPWRIDRWQEEHAMLLPFRDPQQGDLRRLAFERIIEVIDLDESAQVLMSAAEQPILIEQPLGNGTALYCTTSADRNWSNWPQHRLYVPLVRQMLAYLTGQLSGQLTVADQLVQGSTTHAGIYEENGQTLVRNLDPQESILDRVTESEFRESYSLPERDKSKVREELSTNIALPAGTEQASEFWDRIMIALLVLLTAEVLLASRVHA